MGGNYKMSIEEIFEGEEHLLDSPAVKKLLAHVESSHKNNWTMLHRYKKFWDDVLETVMYSDKVLIKGTDSNKTVEKILDLTNKF